MNIEITQATVSDLNAVSAILTEAAEWLLTKGGTFWLGDEIAEDRIHHDIQAGSFYIAHRDGYPAGVFKLQQEDILFWPDAEPQEALYIHRVAVRRKHAGQGVSSAIIQYAKEQSIAQGRRYLRLDCLASRSKLCAIYEKEGFIKHSDLQVGSYFVSRYQFEIDDPQVTGNPMS